MIEKSEPLEKTEPRAQKMSRSRHRLSSRQQYRKFVRDFRSKSHLKDPAPGVGSLESGTRAQISGNRDYLRDYLRWLRPHRYGIAAGFIFALFATALEMINPLFMRFIVDRVLLNTGLDAAAKLSYLKVTGLLFLAAIVLAKVMEVLRDYRQRLINVRVAHSIRKSLYERFLRLPLPKLWEMKTGGILSRLTGDVDTTAGLLQLAVVSPSLSIIRLAVAIVLLFALNWRLALMALILVPSVMVVSYIFSRRIRPIQRSIRKDVEQIDAGAVETFSGIRVVRAFRCEMRELFCYVIGRNTVLRKEFLARRRDLFLSTCWELLLGAVSVAIISLGGYLNLTGRATIGDIMAFQWYTFLLLNPVRNIVASFSELQRSLTAMERVFEVLTMENDKPDRPDARDAPRVVQQLRFEHVEFEYRKGQPVIHDFNLTVPGGSVVALVGRSGAGKTTVTDLVARFHDPTRGRILLNGSDIRDFRLKTYRDLLAIVQQDVFVFDGSVRDNIAYGRRNATDAEIEDAARRANAHEFIVKLPEQYETFIGERGVKLSGGQRQRLAIARAIVASPQMLILDEATSSVDTESEQLIQASMASLFAGRTTFVIAHRLSTVRRADLILLVKDGRVIEQGTHDELMRARGAYYDMVVCQVQSHGHFD